MKISKIVLKFISELLTKMSFSDYSIKEYDSNENVKNVTYKNLSYKDLVKIIKRKYSHRFDVNGSSFIEILEKDRIIKKEYIE